MPSFSSTAFRQAPLRAKAGHTVQNRGVVHDLALVLGEGPCAPDVLICGLALDDLKTVRDACDAEIAAMATLPAQPPLAYGDHVRFADAIHGDQGKEHVISGVGFTEGKAIGFSIDGGTRIYPASWFELVPPF